MKFLSVGIVLMALSLGVTAAPQLTKRASTGDVADSGYAKYGGTTGGSGGSVINVATLAELTSAVAGDSPKIIIITAPITGSVVLPVGSNTSIIGKNPTVGILNGVGLRVLEKKNVIIRNLKISKVLADVGDAIGIQAASNVWIDHCDLSSDRDHDKDYYDGLIDITHGVDYVTVSNTKLYDHWKGSLVGHSDNNVAEDKGHLTVSYHHNCFSNINSRTPSYRFGTGHIWNNHFLLNGDGINTRMGAKLLVENNLFEGCKKALYSTDAGYATATGNIYGAATVDYLDATTVGNAVSVPYQYTLATADTVYKMCNSTSNIVGNILTF